MRDSHEEILLKSSKTRKTLQKQCLFLLLLEFYTNIAKISC